MVYCNDVECFLHTVRILYNRSDGVLFVNKKVNKSEKSLRIITKLWYQRSFNSLCNSVYVEETYRNLKVILDTNHMMTVCGVLKVLAVLLGLQF